MRTLGQRIKKVRELRGMSRKELGEKVGFKNPDIRVGAYETGKKNPGKEMTLKLAKGLEVTTFWLTTGKLDKETRQSIDKIDSEVDPLLELLGKNQDLASCFEEFYSFLMMNEILIKKCFKAKDWENMYNSCLTLIENKIGNLNDLFPFMTIEEFREWQQEENEWNNLL